MFETVPILLFWTNLILSSNGIHLRSNQRVFDHQQQNIATGLVVQSIMAQCELALVHLTGIMVHEDVHHGRKQTFSRLIYSCERRKLVSVSFPLN